ncbi:uncharacterized protein LOC141703978 [Apium graveolens]|uniref:uncharacterized protein LOC141703978 n=1 Tax=Apium graveolens TaxID=4045 RepID=UPI003D79CF9C
MDYPYGHPNHNRHNDNQYPPPPNTYPHQDPFTRTRPVLQPPTSTPQIKQSYKMDNLSLLNEMARSNAIFNLSNMEDDEEDHHYESEADESDDDEKDDDEQDDSDHSTDNDGEHIPTAAWFTTEEIDGSSSNCSNVNSLDDKLFEGQCFPD